MNLAEKVRKLRDEMGMNRREFCDYYAIPYRTVVDCLPVSKMLGNTNKKAHRNYNISGVLCYSNGVVYTL